MTYTSCVQLPARQINNRIIPRLWKLSRADGSFDLFSLSCHQHNCTQMLAGLGSNYASFWVGRDNSDSIRDWNLFSISGNGGSVTNRTTFTTLSAYISDGTRYGSVPKCAFRLNLRNPSGLFPYSIGGHSYSDHNGGRCWLRAYNVNTSAWDTKYGGAYNRGNWNGGSARADKTIWTFDTSSPSSIFDWKDYNQISFITGAVDGSKYTGASCSLFVTFVHRFNQGNELYRYYT